MIDFIGITNGLLSIAEKMRNLLQQSRQGKKSSYEAVRKEAQSTVQEVSALIEKFSEMAGLIVDTRQAGNHARSNHSLSSSGRYPIGLNELYRLNRKLYEISGDMQVFILSLTQRFPEVDTIDMRRLKDACLQLYYVEDFLYVTLGSRSETPFVEPEPDESGLFFSYDYGNGRGVYLKRYREFPSEHVGQNSPARFVSSDFDSRLDDLQYIHDFLDRLVDCKVLIAVALEEIVTKQYPRK